VKDELQEEDETATVAPMLTSFQDLGRGEAGTKRPRKSSTRDRIGER
jgi:hypothetical protein